MTTSPNAPRPCEICGGPAPLTQDDSSHDDCVPATIPTTQDPFGHDVLVVERVSYTATFELRYNGHDFYTLSSGAFVAVAR
jgi:hypothetical protein